MTVESQAIIILLFIFRLIHSTVLVCSYTNEAKTRFNFTMPGCCIIYHRQQNKTLKITKPVELLNVINALRYNQWVPCIDVGRSNFPDLEDGVGGEGERVSAA